MPLLEIILIFTGQIINIQLLKGNSQLSIPLLFSGFDTWVTDAERFHQLSGSWKSNYNHIDQVWLLIFFLLCKETPVDLLVLTANPDFFWFKHKYYFFSSHLSLRIGRILWPQFFCCCLHMLLQGVQGMRKTEYIHMLLQKILGQWWPCSPAEKMSRMQWNPMVKNRKWEICVHTSCFRSDKAAAF